MTATTPLFAQHSRRWRDNRYVYPVISRRSRGLSIGINLSPSKACTFQCVYCSVDRTVPGVEGPVDLKVLAQELDTLLAQTQDGTLFAEEPLAGTPQTLRRLNDVAFSGDGEPTLAPEFPLAAPIVAEALQRRGLDAKIVVITNASLLDKPEVVRTLAFLDKHRGEVWAKLDAGTAERFREMDRSAVSFEQVLSNILVTGRARPIVIQSMFARLHGQPPAVGDLEAWLGRLRDLQLGGCRIDRVQVYTAARRTAEAFVLPLEDVAVDTIAARVRALGLNAEAFYGPR
jgi:wyosine [tRNA(Phe)-imidazoG37] synthetase (radical SAM superfamily)